MQTLATYNLSDIQNFLRSEIGVDEEQLAPSTSLLDDLGVDCDDFDELMGNFAEQFGVDLSGYRWYFHHHEERVDPAVLFFKLPSYDLMPVTPSLLVESANCGTWRVAYPPHRAPRRGCAKTALSYLLIFLILMLFPWAVMKLINLFAKIVHHR